MEQLAAIRLIFGILLSCGGAVLLYLAVGVFSRYLTMEKRCTAKTTGVVRTYTFAAHGPEDSAVHLPVLRYTVEGKSYKVVGPVPAHYASKSSASPFAHGQAHQEQTPHGGLYTARTENAFVRVRKNPMAEQYPIGAELPVFYDPLRPKHAYVLRCPKRKWMFYLTLGAAVAVLAVDAFVLFLL